MRTLTEAQTSALTRDLDSAGHQLREHAAQHSYRADACKAVGERVLADYHRQHHGQVLGLADSLDQHSQHLDPTDPT